MGKIRLDAPAIYSGVQQLTGISRSTFEAAKNGDKSAADTILKFSELATMQAENARTLMAAWESGISAIDEMTEAEASFLEQAGKTLTSATKLESKVQQADLKYQHSTKEVLLESKLQINQLQQNHKRKICLLPQQYKTDETIADIQFKQKRYQLTQRVNDVRESANADKKQLTPRQQQLEGIRSLSGSAGNVGSKVGGWFGGIFRGLFGA
jgi:hypothetical protein